MSIPKAHNFHREEIPTSPITELQKFHLTNGQCQVLFQHLHCEKGEYMKVKARDRVHIMDETWKICIFGSVASYALQHNECPINAFAHAIENDHPIHWLLAECNVVSGNGPDLEGVIEVNYGQKFLFEGRLFRVEKAISGNDPSLISIEIPEKEEENNV